MHNMGIYSKNQEMLCYLWSEYDGDKKTDVILSLMWEHYSKLPEGIRVVVDWTDNCAYQNKSWQLFFMCAYLMCVKGYEIHDITYREKTKIIFADISFMT